MVAGISAVIGACAGLVAAIGACAGLVAAIGVLVVNGKVDRLTGCVDELSRSTRCGRS